VLGVLILVPLMAFFTIQHPVVQKYLVDEATHTLSTKFSTTVSVGSIHFRLFNRLMLRDIYVQDLCGDTLISAQKLSISLTNISIKRHRLDVGTLRLSGGSFNLEKDSVGTNLSFISEAFAKSDTARPAPTEKQPWHIVVNRVVVENMAFSFENPVYDEGDIDSVINFANLRLNNISCEVSHFKLGDTLRATLEGLTFRERSGFYLKELSGNVRVCSKFIDIQNLRLQDQYSLIRAKYYRMDYERFAQFAESYVDYVSMSADFTGAKLDLYSISFFAKKFPRTHLPITLTGAARGPVTNLKGRGLQLAFGSQTKVKVDFSLNGLPEVAHTFFDIEIRDLVSDQRDIHTVLQQLKLEKVLHQSSVIEQLGSVSGKLRYTGFLSDFVLASTLTTGVGGVVTDLAFKPSPDSSIFLEGSLAASEFDLGKLLNISDLGLVTLSGKASGTVEQAKKLSINTDLEVPRIDYRGYTYRGVKLKGLVTDRKFLGNLTCNDKNLQLNFQGRLDFEKELPVFDYKLNLYFADLVKLGLNKRDSISQLELNAVVNYAGKTLDNSSGTANISKVKYTSGAGVHTAANIRAEVSMYNGVEKVILRSDIIDADVVAKGNLRNALHILEGTLEHYMPRYGNILGLKPQDSSENHGASYHTDEYTIYVRTKRLAKLLHSLMPDIYLADSTTIAGHVAAEKSAIRLELHSSKLAYKNVALQDVSLRLTPGDSTLLIKGNVNSITNENSPLLGNLEVKGTLSPGGLSLSSAYSTAIASGGLHLHCNFFKNAKHEKSLEVFLFPSKVALGKSLWDLSKCSIRVEPDLLTIRGLQLEYADQHVRVEGTIAKNQRDTLAVNLHNLDIGALLKLSGKQIDLIGIASGDATINGIRSESPLFFANLDVTDIYFDQKLVGNLTLKSFLEPGERDLTLLTNINRGGRDMVSLGGAVRTNGNVVANAKLSDVDLYFLSPLLQGVLSNIQGNVSGNVNVSGSVKNLKLNGKLKAQDISLLVDYLNTKYDIANGPLEFNNSTLLLKNAVALDDQKRQATVSLTVGNVTQPKQCYYSVDVAPRNFHVLNTTELQNDLFYGQAYATGAVQISGKSGSTNIRAAAATDKNTNIFIPLSHKAQVRQTSFIDFVSKSGTKEKEKDEDESKQPTDLVVDLNLNVSNDADISLVLNEATGDIIRASGSGNIKMEVEPVRDIFRIFGDYTIQKGSYSISLQNIVNRVFKIESGGRISFNGSINDATADIQAVYKIPRVSLSDLFGGDTTSRYRRSVPIDCKVYISGKLVSPTFKFAIDAPTADVDTRERMQAQLNTEDNITTQFLSLLIINRFVPTQDDATAAAGVLATNVTVGELIASQVGNVFSQMLGGKANLNVIYNPAAASGATDGTDYGVALSTSFFSDRLLLTGTAEHQRVVSTGGGAGNENDWVGDVDVEVLLDKNGKLRVKAFSHSNDQYTEMVTGANRYGVGVVYQEEFNSFSELWDAMFRRNKKSEGSSKKPTVEKPFAPPDSFPAHRE
jgi:hypothetical protein